MTMRVTIETASNVAQVEHVFSWRDAQIRTTTVSTTILQPGVKFDVHVTPSAVLTVRELSE
jgi:hypothetical protein